MEKTAVVTGGTRGIGRAVAAELARRGFAVVLSGRDAAAGAEVVRTLGGRARFVEGDLSSVAGARAFGASLVESVPRIDLFVHNAGLWPSQRELGPEGLERAFVVNHVAPFLLNHVLEPRFLESRTRIVTVAAGLHVKGKLTLGRTETGEDFHAIRTYATTKLANLVVLPLFARRWEGRGPTIAAVHPGVIRTDLGARGGLLGLVLRLVKRSWKSPEEGARPVVRLALDPEPAATNGAYFDEDTRTETAPAARDAALADALWARTCELVGIA